MDSISACYTFSAPNPTRLNTTIARLDYNLDAFRNPSTVPARKLSDGHPPHSLRNFRAVQPINVVRDTSRAIAAGYTATLSNTLVNSFRFGLTRQSQANAGIENGPNVTFRFYDDLHPSINSVSPSTSATTNFQIPVYNWTDDLSWTKGKHTLQFGTNIRHIVNDRATGYRQHQLCLHQSELPARWRFGQWRQPGSGCVWISGSGSQQPDALRLRRC